VKYSNIELAKLAGWTIELRNAGFVVVSPADNTEAFNPKDKPASFDEAWAIADRKFMIPRLSEDVNASLDALSEDAMIQIVPMRREITKYRAMITSMKDGFQVVGYGYGETRAQALAQATGEYLTALKGEQ